MTLAVSTKCSRIVGMWRKIREPLSVVMDENAYTRDRYNGIKRDAEPDEHGSNKWTLA